MSKFKINLPLYVLAIIFFIIYLKILNHIFNLRIPLTPIADFLSVLILIFIIIPISFITAHFFVKFIKNS
ncbi:hypothetical protein [Bacillus andreraoultii]|uniref:hypothetical protein n=1 Tax=Bacillus andreraoultii TaxID=1499685 RepID=UPI000539DB79|nr:hypothetical protein [Bacillus andreraoultii]